MDPQAFWRLTPREWSIQIEAAVASQTDLRNRIAIASWVGHHANHKDLEAFVSAAAGPLPEEALERMLKSASAGLTVISMDEYLQGRSS